MLFYFFSTIRQKAFGVWACVYGPLLCGAKNRLRVNRGATKRFKVLFKFCKFLVKNKNWVKKVLAEKRFL
jgi:hypothetical protein